MGIRFYRAYTPGNRNRSVSDFTEITRSKPEKSLTYYKHNARGRNNRGVITSQQEVVVTNDYTDKLISVVISVEFLPLYLVLNMIQTVMHVLPYFIIKMGKRGIFYTHVV